MTKQYDYGLTFWNEELDHEIHTIFQAQNYFDAERIAGPVEALGYVKGVVTFINDRDKSYFDTPLEDLTRKISERCVE